MFNRVFRQTFKIPYVLTYTRFRDVKNEAGTVVFLHGIASSKDDWSRVEEFFPKNLDLISIDLLGHGDSPTPHFWEGQNLEWQARSIARTLRRMGCWHNRKPLFLIGHSMGALISVEMAKRYPRKFSKVFLLSPPVYRNTKEKQTLQEKWLKSRFEFILNKPEESIKIINNVIAAGMAGGVEKIKSQDEFKPLLASLRNAIVYQDTYSTLLKLRVLTKIIYGIFDPVVIGKNIRKASKKNPKFVEFKRILASHDFNKEMLQTVIADIDKILKERNE